MVYLAQTDTTAGLLSKNLEKLNTIKGRKKDQPCVITVANLEILKNFTRVPAKFKNLTRRANKTTIIYPNKNGLRVVKDKRHLKFLNKLNWCYSTSANRHKMEFDKEWAISVADEIVDCDFSQNQPSKIVKISKTKIKKIR